MNIASFLEVQNLRYAGEISFVLANIARAGGAISEEVFDLIISVSILSLLQSPYMVNYALPLANAILLDIYS